jgi:hypothetical protein
LLAPLMEKEKKAKLSAKEIVDSYYSKGLLTGTTATGCGCCPGKKTLAIVTIYNFFG